MKKTRVAINGFGRIGRTLTRLLVAENQIDVVAINDLADIHTMAHLFRYDSVHGRWKGEVKTEGNNLIFNNQSVSYHSEKNLDMLPWKHLEVDLVVECTGAYKTTIELKKHLSAGASKVLLCAPPEDEVTKTIVLGVNDGLIDPADTIISNASCTTNNAAPMIKIIDDAFGIEYCYITTVHSYTGDQRLHDAPHKDWRRGRAAAESIVPTSTGAAKALTRIFPHLEHAMGGCGIRVPVPNGSLTDITCTVKRPSDVAMVNALFQQAAKTHMMGIVEYTEDPIVSRDIIGNPNSCILDAQLTSVIGNMVKVVGWYDNEYGYSNRLADLILRMTTNG